MSKPVATGFQWAGIVMLVAAAGAGYAASQWRSWPGTMDAPSGALRPGLYQRKRDGQMTLLYVPRPEPREGSRIYSAEESGKLPRAVGHDGRELIILDPERRHVDFYIITESTFRWWRVALGVAGVVLVAVGVFGKK